MSDKDKTSEDTLSKEEIEKEEAEHADVPREPLDEPSAAPPAPAAAVQPAPAPVNPPPAQTAPAAVAPIAAGADTSVTPPGTPPASPSDLAGIPPAQDTAQRTQKHQDFAQDLSTGPIAPKTYQQLFAKNSDGSDRGTLGKLGMMFGLMLSSGGAGVTGQPNMFLDMMNKEIERDYQGQVADQTNRQNWYRLALEHEKMLPEVAFRSAEAKKMGSEADFARWNNVQAGVNDMSASDEAKNYSTLAYLQDQQNTIDRMAPGAPKINAQNTFNTVVKPYFTNQITQRTAQGSQKRALVNSTNPIPVKPNPPPKGAAQPGVAYDAIDKGKYAQMVRTGRFAPGGVNSINPSDVASSDKEVADLEWNRKNLATAVDIFHKLAALPNAGEVPVGHMIPSLGGLIAGAAGLLGGPMMSGVAATAGNMLTRQAGETMQQYLERSRNVLVDSLRNRLGGNISKDEKEELIRSVMPAFSDKGDTRQEAFNQLVQHFKDNPSENTPTLDRYAGIKNPVPNYVFKEPKVAGESSGIKKESSPIKTERSPEQAPSKKEEPKSGSSFLNFLPGGAAFQ